MLIGFGNRETGVRTRMGEKIQKFEDLEVWKESMRLAEKLYNQLKDCHNFALRDQIQRSALSIPSNIAEGFERNSNKEFIRFLSIAQGSCAELRTQLYLVKRIKLFDSDIIQEYINRSRDISAMIARLIQVRREKFT